MGKDRTTRVWPALVLLALVGCGGKENVAPAPAEASLSQAANRIVIGVRGDVSSLNVYTATNAFTQEIADLLYLKLAQEGDDYQEHPPSFLPALARSWELSPDRLTLTFRLDPAARWSDGTPVTSRDVLFSHRAATDPAVGWVGRDTKEFVSAVEAPDPATVVYRFQRAYPYPLMDAVEGNVLPAHVFEATPLSAWPKTAFFEAAVTDGPFRLSRYERGSTLELERNPSYLRAGLPRLERVVFRILPEEATLVNELLSGGIDVMENVPAEDVARIQATGRFKVERVPDLAYTFICWNTSRPLFADARVRRALTMAIDRAAIVEGLLPGTGRSSSGPIPSALWAHDPAIGAPPYDPDAARELLASSGFREGKDGLLERGGRPFRFELQTSHESGLRTRVAEMVSAQLRKLGIEAQVRPLEFGSFVEGHEKHAFDAFVGTLRESTKIDLKSVFHSSAAEGGYNYGLYRNPELDAAIDEARTLADPEAARRAWHRVEEIVVQDQPYTFLYERDRLHAAPKDLQGFRPVPRSVYAGLEEWSWSDGARR